MKRFTYIVLVSCLLSVSASADVEVNSTIDRITVFLNGAQITRHFNANLKKGVQVVKVKDLSPYIDPKTIQVKGNGEFTILSIRHQLDFLNEKELEGDLKRITDSIYSFKQQIEEINIELNLLNHSESFLQSNRVVKGNDALKHEDLMKVHQYYFSELSKINTRRYKLNRETLEINQELGRLQRQLNALNSRLVTTSSEVLVEIEAPQSIKGEFEVSYLVNNASWFPSYDIRVEDITQPLRLVYKANVQQNTGVDWNNVELTFSNANPYESGNLPILKPYHLNYVSVGYTRHSYARTDSDNSYNLKNYISNGVSEARGRVVSSSGEPIAYATIKISGTSIGTFTDEGGNFAISLPAGKTQAYVQMIGYKSNYYNLQTTGSNSVVLQPSAASLSEVLVEADHNKRSYIDGVSIQKLPSRSVSAIASVRSKKMYEDKNITVLPLENQTSMEITLDRRFTIKSSGKQKLVSMNTVDIPAYYEHRSVPKLDAAAFLIARIADWSAYNLMEGEANLYFENTYIGKSILDVRYITDTLNISLGRDRNVLINRQKVKSQSMREFIGRDNIEKRAYQIEVKNNKSQGINLVIYDQVPISSRPKEITVELRDRGGAYYTERTGELKWETTIKPGDNKKMEFKYQVKFPKNQTINLE